MFWGFGGFNLIPFDVDRLELENWEQVPLGNLHVVLLLRQFFKSLHCILVLSVVN